MLVCAELPQATACLLKLHDTKQSCPCPQPWRISLPNFPKSLRLAARMGQWASSFASEDEFPEDAAPALSPEAAVMTTLLGGVATKLWTSYNRSLAVNPLLTKSLTSFSGFILGDGIAQLATKGRENYDFARTARFAAFGFCIHAPGCHYFYHLLDAAVFPAAPKSTKAVLAKMLIDQTIWTPISICIFYTAFKAMEGRTDQITQTIREKFWPTLLAGYAVWPVAHVINFRFIQNEHRLLYINCVQVGWNVVLSKIATSKGASDNQKKVKLGEESSDSKLRKIEEGSGMQNIGGVALTSRKR